MAFPYPDFTVFHYLISYWYWTVKLCLSLLLYISNCQAAIFPLTPIVTSSQFDFYLIFIIRLPFPSPGSLNTSYMTSSTSFPISVPQFLYLSHKVSVNINELGWHLKQCLAQWALTYCSWKLEWFKYEHIILKYLFLFVSFHIGLWITSI